MSKYVNDIVASFLYIDSDINTELLLRQSAVKLSTESLKLFGKNLICSARKVASSSYSSSRNQLAFNDFIQSFFPEF